MSISPRAGTCPVNPLRVQQMPCAVYTCPGLVRTEAESTIIINELMNELLVHAWLDR
jgi:hypothetical protein